MSAKKKPIEPMASVKGDLRKVRESSSATADELKGFLAELRGKSPQEMLGLVAQSSLVQCCITASIIFVVILLSFTVVPYGWGMLSSKKKEVAKTEQQAKPDKPAAKKPGESPANPAEPAVAANPKPKENDPLAETLGIGDAVVSPLDSNPLDNKGDDLFKDLE